MRSWKDVVSRKEERENLRNFLLSFVMVFVLVLSFFGAYVMKELFHDTPETRKTRVVSVEGEVDGSLRFER